MYVSNPHSIQNTEVFDVNNKEAYNIKVVKFGGSSLASAEQFVKVANIVKAEDSRKYVVPSAPGKRFSGDTKVTDMFYECYNVSAAGGNIDEIFDKVCERYNLII